MLTIISGDFESLKPEMKNAKQIQNEITKSLRRRYKDADFLPESVRIKIDKSEQLQKMYTPSSVLPVKVDGITINYKLYEAFIKKLKGARIKTFKDDNGLLIQYWVKGRLNEGKGLLKLYDISSFYLGFKHIPEARIEE